MQTVLVHSLPFVWWQSGHSLKHICHNLRVHLEKDLRVRIRDLQELHQKTTYLQFVSPPRLSHNLPSIIYYKL